MRYFIFIIIGVVAAAIIIGFFIVDSPAEERLRKFDEQRVVDLSFIQSEIINHWMKKGVLPKTLTDLKDDIRGFSIPTDPESEEMYSYEVTENLGFYLCANFLTNNLNEIKPLNKPISYPQKPVPMYQRDYPDWWGHGIGRVCFERKIDPELYPVIKK